MFLMPRGHFSTEGTNFIDQSVIGFCNFFQVKKFQKVSQKLRKVCQNSVKFVKIPKRLVKIPKICSNSKKIVKILKQVGIFKHQ